MAVRIGVIGIGVHGMHHVRLLSKMPGVDFLGVHDSSASTAENVAREFSMTAFTTPAELIEAVDCVVVAVPTSRHHDVVMECLRRGRHVLVEKPIAATVDEATEMSAEAESRGLVLAVGHVERFNSAFRSVAASAGAPLFIEAHRLSVFNPRGTDVAVVLDLMIHDIDVVLAMVDRPVVSIAANGVSVVSDEIDIANARIEFEGGAVANLTASRISQKKLRKTRAFQKNAYISMDFLTGESEVFALAPGDKPTANPGDIPSLMGGISYVHHPNDGLNALEEELADFIRAVRDGGRPAVTGREGTEALSVASRVLAAVSASMRLVT